MSENGEKTFFPPKKPMVSQKGVLITLPKEFLPDGRKFTVIVRKWYKFYFVFSKNLLSSKCSTGGMERSLTTTSKSFQLIANDLYRNGQNSMKKHFFKRKLIRKAVRWNRRRQFWQISRESFARRLKVLHSKSRKDRKDYKCSKKLFFLKRSSGHVECILQSLVVEKFDRKSEFFRSVSKNDKKL